MGDKMKKIVKIQKMTALFLTAVMLFSSVGTNAFISNAQGNMLEQEVHMDDTISGNTVSGNTVSDNNPVEETISGNTVSDNNAVEESVSGNAASDNNPIENTVPENTVSDNNPSVEAEPVETVSDNNPIEETTSGNTVSCNEPDEKVIVDNNMDGSLSKKPTRPIIDNIEKNNIKTTVNTTTKSITIKAQSGCTIYYSTNGKNPTYKNGVLSDNASKYSASFNVGSASKVVIKAISVNAAGLCSPVATQTYMFKPAVSKIVLSAPGSTTNTETGAVTVNLVKGKSLQLKANFTPDYAPDKKMVWELTKKPTNASDEVKVSSSGKVTTKKTAVAGSYTITGTLKSNIKVKTTITVKVVDTAIIDKIELKKKTIPLVTTSTSAVSYKLFPEMKITATKTLTAKDFVWSSSNKEIATVGSDGIVKSVPGIKGTATITAVAKDGSGKSVKFTVKVSQLATKVTITGNAKVGIGKSQQLKATVAPEKVAGSKVKWEITAVPSGADASAVKISPNGKFTATKNAKAGSYTVKATAQDGSAKYGTFSISVLNSMKSIDIDPEKKEGKQITLYRTKGSDTIAAVASKNVKVEAFTTDDKASANFEVVSSLPGVVSATYNSRSKAITIKATGNGTGTATITCRAVDGSGKKDTIKVKVINPPSSIAIQLPKGSTGDLVSGYTHKLDAVIGTKYGNPGSVQVKWELVNEPGGVSINEKTGALKIEKSVYSGKQFNVKATVKGEFKLSKTVKVTVKNSITRIALTGMVSDPNNFEITKGVKDKKNIYVIDSGRKEKDLLSATSSSVGTTKNFSVSSNSNMLKVSYSAPSNSIAIESDKVGTYSITVQALDGTGKKVVYKVRVKE